jgi:Phage T4 tail fibre
MKRLICLLGLITCTCFANLVYAQSVIDGRVQIVGDTSPTTLAGVEIGYTSADGGQVVAYDRNAQAYKFLYLSGSGLGFITSATEKMRILPNGNVGIGTMTPDSKLTVAGNIHSREVKVTINAGADFVFQEDYNLKSLKEVESFIKTNKHLPDVEPAKEMERKE